jgi:disulfide oxidoreductase YuzD
MSITIAGSHLDIYDAEKLCKVEVKLPTARTANTFLTASRVGRDSRGAGSLLCAGCINAKVRKAANMSFVSLDTLITELYLDLSGFQSNSKARQSEMATLFHLTFAE